MALSFQEAEGCAAIWFVDSPPSGFLPKGASCRRLRSMAITDAAVLNRKFVSTVQESVHNGIGAAGSYLTPTAPTSVANLSEQTTVSRTTTSSQ